MEKSFLDSPNKVIIIKEKSSGTLVKTTRAIAYPYLQDGSHTIVPKQKLKSFINKEAKTYRKQRAYQNHLEVIRKKIEEEKKLKSTATEGSTAVVDSSITS